MSGIDPADEALAAEFRAKVLALETALNSAVENAQLAGLRATITTSWHGTGMQSVHVEITPRSAFEKELLNGR